MVFDFVVRPVRRRGSSADAIRYYLHPRFLAAGFFAAVFFFATAFFFGATFFFAAGIFLLLVRFSL